MKCYLLVHKAHKHIIAIYLNKETAIKSKLELDETFNAQMYDIIEKEIITI